MSSTTNVVGVLSELVAQTVHEMDPEPVPETMVYLAFQEKGIGFDLFQQAIAHAVASKRISKGPMHTLVSVTHKRNIGNCGQLNRYGELCGTEDAYCEDCAELECR